MKILNYCDMTYSKLLRKKVFLSFLMKMMNTLVSINYFYNGFSMMKYISVN